jgi:hypothetical protein
MSSKFGTLVNTANRLISNFGQSVTWVRIASVTNSETPWAPETQTRTEVPVDIAFLPVGVQARAYIQHVVGEVPGGSTLGYMGDVGFQPVRTDVVLRDGIEWRIEKVETIQPDGFPILHIVWFLD